MSFGRECGSRMHVYVNAQVCVLGHLSGGQWGVSGAIICHALPQSIETGLLSKPGAHCLFKLGWQPQHGSNSPVSTLFPQLWVCRHTQPCLTFHVGGRRPKYYILSSVLHIGTMACAQKYAFIYSIKK